MNDTGNDNGFVGQKRQDPWKQRQGARGAWIAIALIVAALVVTVAIIQGAYHRSRNIPELPESRKVASTNAPSPAELSLSFREVAKAVKPAVVYVNIVENPSADSDQSDFFGLPGQGIPRRREGAASGFIVTEDGYILTNNHVVGNANKIKVTLADGRKFDAEVIGTDVETDIAVIKIDASNLPTAVLARDSDEVEQGDWVLAIGSPFGLQQTLTAGIVSATGRELRESQYNHYIQTDASINPGNSGGPLVNMQGEVVGINTMIVTGGPMSQGNIGIGFAIASNTARDVFKQLVRGGRVTRGYLGVFVTDLDEASAHAFKLETNAGAFVREVPDEGPAAKAGIQAKDVITAFNGKPVRAARELTETVAATSVGQTARVDFIRDGHSQSVTVQLVERPKNVTARAIPSDRGEGEGEGGAIQQGRLGIQGRTVTPEMVDSMKLKLKRPTGVFVASVAPGSAASDAGLQHGDVIHALDGIEVSTVEELSQAVKTLKAGEYLIEVERSGRPIFLKVTFD